MHEEQSEDAFSGGSSSPIKVFISYSWDSKEHLDRVLHLADTLRDDGIDCMIDQYVLSPDNWDRWMVDRIDESDFVLIVCSERYYDRYRGKEENNKGLGAIWESTLIMAKLVGLAGRNPKFYPLFFGEPNRNIIPDGCRNTYYAFAYEEIDGLAKNEDRLKKDGTYQKLYRLLTNQPSTPIRTRGSIRPLPPVRPPNPPALPPEPPRDSSKEGVNQQPSEIPPPVDNPPTREGDGFWAKVKGALSRLPRWSVLPVIGILLLTGVRFNIFHGCHHTIDDSISEGEDILLPGSYPIGPLHDGKKYFRECKYKEALTEFIKAWSKEQQGESLAVNPEVLIYLNNTLLKARNLEHYTLAVAIGFKSEKANQNTAGGELSAVKSDQNIADRSEEILRGVAQLQTKINSGLLKDGDTLLEQMLGENHEDFILRNGINGKGLKLIILNDGNESEAAKQRAAAVSRNQDVMGLIGHYASDMTVDTIDIYSKNRLPVISPGSTTPELTDKPRDNFFRTVFSGRDQSPFLAEFMNQRSISNVVVFYSGGSTFAVPFRDSFEKEFEKFNGHVLKLGGYESRLGKMDFDPVIAMKDIQAKPGVNPNQLGIIVIPSPIGEAQSQSIELVKNLGGANWILGSWGLRNPKTIEGLRHTPKSLAKFVIAVPWDPMTTANQDFLNDALTLWRTRKVAPVTATSYDASLVLFKALKREDKPTRLNLLQQIRSSSVKGATGLIEFDEKGDRKKPHVEFVHIVRCKSATSLGSHNFAPISYNSAKC